MPELYCMNDCTKHKVWLEDNDKETLADMFDMVEFKSISSSYNEDTKEIIITLKESYWIFNTLENNLFHN